MRVRRMFVLGLFLLALVPRMAGMTNGLPYAESEKEQRNVNTALMMGATKSLNPQQVGKGMIWYVLLAEFGTYYGLGRLSGKFSSTFDFAKSIFIDRSEIYLIERMGQVLIALWTLWILYRLCRRLFGEAGALWGLLLGVTSAVHVHASHHASEDMLVVLFGLLALERIILYDGTGLWKHLILSSIFSAACASAKIPGGIALFSVFLVLGVRKEWRRVAASFFVFLISYLAFNPHVLLAPVYAASSLLHDLGIRRTLSGQPIWESFAVLFGWVLGYPLTAAVIAGGFARSAVGKQIRIIAVIPIVAFMLVLGGGSGIGSPSYLMALWPMLMVTAVAGLLWISAGRPKWVTALVGCLVVAPHLLYLPPYQHQDIVWQIRVRTRRVPTVDVTKWVLGNVKSGESIAMMGGETWKGRLFLTPERIRERLDRFKQPPPHMDLNYNLGNIRMYEFMLKVVESDTSVPCYNLRFVDARTRTELEGEGYRRTMNWIEAVSPYDEWANLATLPQRYFMYVDLAATPEREKNILEQLDRYGKLLLDIPPFKFYEMSRPEVKG